MTSRLLRTYLQDHHAAAGAGVALARRARDANRAGPFGRELARLADEIAADRETLERVMDELGVPASRAKDGLAVAAERVARLKPNGRVRSYSPLSRVLELEALVSGITAKAALWRSLEVTLGGRVGGVDLRALHAAALDQARRAEELRVEAARIAFAGRGREEEAA